MAKNRYLIEYYTQDELAYANRKRYKTFSYNASSSEYQYAVRLGDGASTSVKTSLGNLSNYVCISLQTLNDNTQLYYTVFTTRWYVISYVYLNGGQVELFLQRDVIGENGLDGFFGKVERGYTETFLRNRKELSLNQILKSRLPLISSDNKYGNYTVNSHVNEKWGIIYLTKPTEIDPTTQQPYPDNPTINIPAFSPKVEPYPYIQDNTKYIRTIFQGSDTILSMNINYKNLHSIYEVNLIFHFDENTNKWSYTPLTVNDLNLVGTDGNNCFSFTSTENEPIERKPLVLVRILNNFMLKIYENTQNALNFPYLSNNIPDKDYNNKVIEHGNDKIKYTVNSNSYNFLDISYNTLKSYLLSANYNYTFNFVNYTATIEETGNAYVEYLPISKNNVFYVEDTYTYITLTPEQAGNLILNTTTNLIDEPYICYAFPLYDVNITGPNSYSTSIEQKTAFMVFNTVIQACSGENAYLVDAQIYPYCPELSDIACEFSPTNGQKYPFFNISSTAFSRNIEVELKPYLDIKKEYIKRDYYIVSPEQSANYHFNFYDYTNSKSEVIGDNIYNYQKLSIVIRTALKPMNIIASAVIVPQSESLKGITYNSDLRGCQPTSSGFEVSLSTNKFQEYIRNNSNYQSIFALQKEELQRQHRVEQVNETTSAVVNSITATMMGAIGGASLADVSYFGTSAKAVGAIAGAATAGATVGTAMAVQKTQNDKLREYEEYLQQQNFNLQIGTIKNIPNTVSRISSFNEIIMRDFYFVIETYECSSEEGLLVDTFIEKYGYGLGVFGKYEDFERDKWFLKGTLITSNLLPIQHNVAQKEIMGGIYYYE